MGQIRNYVNNRDMLNAYVKYCEECKESIAKGGPDRPYTPSYKYLGECFLLICTRMMNRPNFSGYSYKSEMISDSLLDCSARMFNFSPAKSENIFSYFSSICWNAAVRRLKLEKKQSEIKALLLKNMTVIDEYHEEVQDDEYGVMQQSSKSLLSCIEPIERKPLEKKFKRTTKAHQKRLKDIDEKIALYEKSLVVDEADLITSEDNLETEIENEEE